jgi:hypothetical protein
MSSNFNCSYMARSSLTYIAGFSVKFFFQPIYTDYANYPPFFLICKSSMFIKNPVIHVKKLIIILIQFKFGHILALNQIKPNLAGVGPFQNCVRQPCPPFKMAAVTKNRNFFKWPIGWKKNFTEKPAIYVKLLLAM